MSARSLPVPRRRLLGAGARGVGRRRRRGRELGDAACQRVGAPQELHGGDPGAAAGRLASLLLQQRHEVLVARARPLARAQGHAADVDAGAGRRGGGVLDRRDEVLPTAE